MSCGIQLSFDEICTRMQDQNTNDYNLVDLRNMFETLWNRSNLDVTDGTNDVPSCASLGFNPFYFTVGGGSGNATIDLNSSAFSLSISENVVGSTANDILFIDSLNNLAQSDALQFDPLATPPLLTVTGNINVTNEIDTVNLAATFSVRCDTSAGADNSQGAISAEDSLGTVAICDGTHGLVVNQGSNSCTIADGSTFAFNCGNSTQSVTIADGTSALSATDGSITTSLCQSIYGVTTNGSIAGSDYSASGVPGVSGTDTAGTQYVGGIATVIGSSGGSGTVTSISADTDTSYLSISGVPITGSGTIHVNSTTGLPANQFLATADGVTSIVDLRSIVVGDLGGGTGATANTVLHGDLTWSKIDLGNDVTIVGGTTGNLLYDNAGVVAEVSPASFISGNSIATIPVSLATQVTGNLGVSHLDGGASANSTTYWRGDASWGIPSSPMAVGSSTITSGANGSLLYDNGGVLGEVTQATFIGNNSITTQGNSFNGNSQLMQTTGGGLVPALDGSLLTNLSYTATTSTDWATSTPTTIRSAIDRLASWANTVIGGSGVP